MTAQQGIAKKYTIQGLYADKQVIYTAVVGSRSFGLSNEQSDTDVRGIFLLPANECLGLIEPPLSLACHEEEKDEEYWELRHYLKLALNANPSILEAIYSPLGIVRNKIGQELVDNRHRLLSRKAYMTYSGYAIGQFRKIEQDIRNSGEHKPKHLMHLIRLLLSGIHLFQTGEVLVNVGSYRERLLRIRHGQESWEETNRWREELVALFEYESIVCTKLPEAPDYEWANDFLIRARNSHV